MLTNDQVYAFVTLVLDTYNCGEVPPNVDSQGFFQEAFHALERATNSPTNGEPYLNDFAVSYLHLGQS